MRVYIEDYKKDKCLKCNKMYSYKKLKVKDSKKICKNCLRKEENIFNKILKLI